MKRHENIIRIFAGPLCALAFTIGAKIGPVWLVAAFVLFCLVLWLVATMDNQKFYNQSKNENV